MSFGIGLTARSVLNSVFLHHCVEAGLDLAMVNPNHITPYAEIPDEERDLADDLVFNRREDALERFIAHFEGKSEETAEAADPTAGMEPEEALHWHILRRKKDGVEAQIDAAVEKLGAVPTLNDVLLPAMKEVGDKFGAGELILPFVLQSAEVMKKAVAQLEQYLDKLEGYTKGTVVLATVFGDVHDIGKSLVNTILTNNGYTVVDLGKQVPIGTILDAAQEHEATAIGLSALLVSTSKQMPLAVQELHERGLQYPVLVGGAAINRDFGRRILYPRGKESDEVYDPGVFYCKDAFAGLAVMDQLVEPDKRGALVEKTRDEARKLREKGPEPELGPTDDESVRSAARTDAPVPRAAVLGRARDPRRSRRRVPPPRHARAVQAALGRARQEGRGVAAAGRGGVPAAARAHVARAGLPAPARAARLLPVQRGRQLARALRPRGPRARAGDAGLPAPARATTASASPTSTAPRSPRERDVVAIQAVTAGPQVTDLMAELEEQGEFAEQLYTHGLGVQTAEGMAEWMHARVRSELRHRARPGPPLVVGLSRVPGPVRAHQGLPAARTPSRSASRSPAGTRSSPSSRRWRSSPTTRRPSTSA